MTTYLPLILGMTLVTYIPRWLPLNFLSELDLNPRVKQFLIYIPYTSLSILIVRGLLTTSKDMFIPTFIGIVIAGLASWTKGNLVLSVFLGIFGSFLAIQILS